MFLDVKKVKIAVMIPEGYVEEIREVMCENGCGEIGNYSRCTMTSDIISTFIGNDDSNPRVGRRSVLETYREIKLEALCSIEDVKTVLAAIRRVHPYEEPGIDIYPVICEEDL